MRSKKKSSGMIMYSVKDMKWPNTGTNSSGYVSLDNRLIFSVYLSVFQRDLRDFKSEFLL